MFWLVKRHPALVPVLCEHLRDNEEFLAHPYFGAVTRHYKQLCDLGQIETAEALVKDLDAGLLHGDEDIDNLIHVSFLENLDHEKGTVRWELLTQRLKAGFDMIHGHTEPS